MVRLLLIVIGLMLPLSAAAQTRSFAEDNGDSIAVIIGSKNYSYAERFPVEYAINDASAIRQYLIQFLGFQEKNIIFQRDATKWQLEKIFRADGEGRLMQSVKSRSNVFVFYSGHGVPDPATQRSYLLPTDMSPDNPKDGYALDTLYWNLEKVKEKIGRDRQVIVMIDACFTGETGRGDRLMRGISAPIIPSAAPLDNGLIRLIATSGADPANWDAELGLGLFTSRFLMGVAGLAAPGSASIQWGDLRKYLRETVDADARRLGGLGLGRGQLPEIIGDANFTLPVGEVPAVRKGLQRAHDDALWRVAALPNAQDPMLPYEIYKAECKLNGFCKHLDEAEQRLREIRHRLDVTEDRANWERLSAARRFKEYIDTCNAVCAYRNIAQARVPPRPHPETDGAVPRSHQDASLPCEADPLTDWLREKGAYGGDRTLDTSIYDDRVKWMAPREPPEKTREQITREEEKDRRQYQVQRYTPTTLNVYRDGEQCVITQKFDSYKVKNNGDKVYGAFNITYWIRTDANGRRSIAGQKIETLASR